MRKTLIQLSLVDNVGPATIAGLLRLCEQHGMPFESLASCTPAQLQQLGIRADTAQAIVDALYSDAVYQSEMRALATIGGQCIAIVDDNYPEQLRHIPYPPAVLFVRGDATLLHGACIAIVGARKADRYGLWATQQIVAGYRETQAVIVSGGARGIDATAHESALQHGIPTVVVMGSGFTKPYPREHAQLFEKIVQQGGALVTPFNCRMEPLPGNFPARNRIISGLCQSVTIVQGEEKSGAAITAKFALEQGRQVYAVPGQLDNPLSVLPNNLIYQGAEIVQLKTVASFTAAQSLVGSVVSLFSGASATKKERPVVQSKDDKILAFCAIPRSIDEIAAELSLDQVEVFELVFVLQCAGKIEQNFIGLWQVRS